MYIYIGVDWSFKALCHEADDAVIYTEMEYFVPAENDLDLVSDFTAFQHSVQNHSLCAGASGVENNCSLFTGVRYGLSDEVSWMSQMYHRDIAVVSNIVLGTTEHTGPVEEFEMFGKGLERIATEKYHGRSQPLLDKSVV